MNEPIKVDVELRAKASEELEKEIQTELEKQSEEVSVASLLEEN